MVGGQQDVVPTPATPPVTDDAPRAPRSRLSPRTVTTLVAGALAVGLYALVAAAPVPYAVMRPGPVRDVLGTAGGAPMIEVEGRRTYPTEGSLDLTTVSVLGGPGRTVTLGSVLRGWVDPEVVVLPEAEVFPPGQTRDEVTQQNTQEMVSSQESATAAALRELDVAVPTTLRVAGFAEGSDAAGVLREGDVVTAVSGVRVGDLPQLRDELQSTTAGDPVTVTVRRGGEPVDVEVTTLRGEEGTTLLGVLVDPAYDFPVDVAIQVERIGGPSAGMMFALGIVDKLTPGAMTGGQAVAGTGTVDSAGEVGPIGGIRQKLVGAREAGARWFLAPAGNCDQVVGHEPDELGVVRVATLAQARDAVEAIGRGDTADLPACAG